MPRNNDVENVTDLFEKRPIAVSIKTAAAYLEIHPDTIRGAIARGVLPTYKIGRHFRIEPDDLRACLRNGGFESAAA